MSVRQNNYRNQPRGGGNYNNNRDQSRKGCGGAREYENYNQNNNNQNQNRYSQQQQQNQYNNGYSQQQQRNGQQQQQSQQNNFHPQQQQQNRYNNGYSQEQQQQVPNSNPSSGIGTMFMIETKKDAKAFRYDVKIEDPTKKFLTKNTGPARKAFYKKLCLEIIMTACNKTDRFGAPNEAEFVYDNRATLFSSHKLNIKPLILIEQNELHISVRELAKKGVYSVWIEPTETAHILDLNDLKQYTNRNSMNFEEDRSLRSFLEMLTSQLVINAGTFTQIGSGKLYLNDANAIQDQKNGMAFRSGVIKGVRVVDNLGNPTPAVILDIKTSPFFKAQNLAQTIYEIQRDSRSNPQEYQRILKDIGVSLNSNPSHVFSIGEFSEKPIKDLLTIHSGKKISLYDYYKLKYKITLKHSDMLAVCSNAPIADGKQQIWFPVEVLTVLPDQTVPLEKLCGLSDALLKENTILPHDRYRKTMEMCNKLHLFEDNYVLQAFGIKILKETNKVVLRIRPLPKIKYANNFVVNVDNQKANWRQSGKYIESNAIKNWIVIGFTPYKQDNEIWEKKIKEFVTKYIEAATKKGLIISLPSRIRIFNDMQWTNAFTYFKSLDLVMYINSKENSQTKQGHDLLKYKEATCKISVTQNITYEIVLDIVDKRKLLTLENVINKTNCKFYGINYNPVINDSAKEYDLSNNKILVIGLDVAHPGAATQHERQVMRAKNIMGIDSFDPSVVGITANVAKQPYTIVGDYFYQPSRREAIDVNILAERVCSILQTLEKQRPMAKRPETIIVLRDGISEGQYDMGVNDEVPAIREGCKLYSNNYKPKLVYAIGTKRHFKRFYKLDQGRILNMQPGSVIMGEFTRPEGSNFQMQSHYPIKGVPKPVDYYIPINEAGISMENFQDFLLALCFDHQITNQGVSLPEPIFQADELAKRGRNNFLTMKKIRDPIPKFPSGEIDYRALSNILSYQGCALINTRFTA